MSLTAAVQRAKDAAVHAKPFMKLIDALSDLDGELRGAAQLEKDAQAAAQKKTDLEAAIPALQSEAKALQNTVNSFKAELATRQADFDKSIEFQQQQADKALAEKHVKLEAEHQARINSLKGEISTLGGTISSLEKQKADVEAQIGALRKTFEDAHAALHA
jgi:chromosome segregation ATPase